MRLYVEDEYFEDIRSGKKKIEYREAHLNLVNIKTKEILEKEITGVELIYNFELPKELQNKPFLKQKEIIAFYLGDCTELKLQREEAKLEQIKYNLKKLNEEIIATHNFYNRELEEQKQIIKEIKKLKGKGGSK